MSIQRGDVVILDFPQGPGRPAKRRPAVVVQTDRNNARLQSSIFAMVTSNSRLAAIEPTQVLVDLQQNDAKLTGLVRTSAIKAENLYTLPVNTVLRVIGRMPSHLMTELDSALKSSLALP